MTCSIEAVFLATMAAAPSHIVIVLAHRAGTINRLGAGGNGARRPNRPADPRPGPVRGRRGPAAPRAFRPSRSGGPVRPVGAAENSGRHGAPGPVHCGSTPCSGAPPGRRLGEKPRARGAAKGVDGDE
ncbi:hypothetical protein E4099_05525 [Streptomyces palmae]|uniref:Uncharacterized protein n=1 Tax=Streptomyces palmae TaxID=1701085 RepID=A0A4Z0HG63_9ACTN|nr:hypothetical protein E4099_05525 [Streptomyces palmae]